MERVCRAERVLAQPCELGRAGAAAVLGAERCTNLPAVQKGEFQLHLLYYRAIHLSLWKLTGSLPMEWVLPFKNVEFFF